MKLKLKTYPLYSKPKEVLLPCPVVMVNMEETHTDDAEDNHTSQNAKHAVDHRGDL